MINGKVQELQSKNYNYKTMPEYFPYSGGRQSKQEPRDLQKCTALHQ